MRLSSWDPRRQLTTALLGLACAATASATIQDATLSAAAALVREELPALQLVEAGDVAGAPREAVGFRVWRQDPGEPRPRVDPVIYVSRDSDVYRRAAADVARGRRQTLAVLILAGHLVHEHMHGRTPSERAAYTAEAHYLRRHLGVPWLTATDRAYLTRLIQAIETRARALP